MQLNADNPKDVEFGLTVLLTSAVVEAGGELKLTRAATEKVLSQGLMFDFNEDAEGNGVLTIVESTVDPLLALIAELAGISPQELLK